MINRVCSKSCNDSFIVLSLLFSPLWMIAVKRIHTVAHNGLLGATAARFVALGPRPPGARKDEGAKSGDTQAAE